MTKNLILFDFDETIVSNYEREEIIAEVLHDFVLYSKYPNNDVVILTARYQRGPVIDFFKKLGIANVEVVAVGELNPLAKSAYVLNKLSQKNYRAVKVYEDKIENIKEIEKVVRSQNVAFSSVHIQSPDAIQDLRNFVGLTLDGEKDVPKSPGSGIVVVRKFDDEWKVLGLKLEGQFDLPKGKMEKGETEFQAALRETLEESGIDDLDFKWGQQSTSIKHLTFFVAQTSQDAYIPQNPESGIYEHDSAEWVSFEKMKSKCYNFLVPVVDWAESIVVK